MTNIIFFGVNQENIRILHTNILLENICITEYDNQIDINKNEIGIIYSRLENNQITPVLISQENKFIYKLGFCGLEENIFISISFDAYDKHEIKKYDLSNLFAIETIEINSKIEARSILSKKSQILLCETDNEYQIILRQLLNCEEIYFQGHTNYINDVSVFGEKNIFASVGRDKTLKLWNIKEKKCIETIAIERNSEHIILSEHLDCLKVIGWGGDSGLWIWDFKNKKYIINDRYVYLIVVYNCVINDDEIILTGNPDGIIECFSIKENKYIWSSSIQSNWIYTIKLCPSKDLLIISGQDGIIYLLDVRTGEIRQKLIGHENGVWNIISFDNVLITSGFDETIRIWNLDNSTCCAILTGHTHKITHMVISNDKKYLVSCDKMGYIFAWKANWDNLF